MKVIVSYWADFEKRTLILDTTSGFPRRTPYENIESIQSHIPLVEIDLPIEDETVIITVPIGTSLQATHSMLVLR